MRQIFIILFCQILFFEINAQEIKYTYDKDERMVQVTYPNQMYVSYLYDKDGNRTGQTITKPIATAINLLDSNISKLLVSPNPTSGLINLQLELLQPDNFSILIYAIDGRLTLQQEYKHIQKLNYQFDISRYSSGVYELVIRTNKGIKKWSIEKISNY